MTGIEDKYRNSPISVFTIVHTAADADHGVFQDPVNYGSFLSRESARKVMASLVEEEKERLSPRYDTVEEDEDRWETYEDGYAAARFSRFEILSSALRFEGADVVTERCPHCEAEITMCWSVKEYGYQVFCPVCGKPLMLCDECRHAGGIACDYREETNSSCLMAVEHSESGAGCCHREGKRA